MSALSLAVMVLVCGVVWGGFAVLLVRAVRREAGKRRDGGAPGEGVVEGAGEGAGEEAARSGAAR